MVSPAATVSRYSGHAERGATLLEAAISISLFGSVILLVNAMVSEETERQRDAALGGDLKLMTQFATRYVAAEYDAIRLSLAGLSGTNAITAISMQDVADAGHLPPSMLVGGEHRNGERQTYSIVVRGVSRLNTDIPQTTLAISALDANGDGLTDAGLMDGIAGNDELDLEALLVTSGGAPVPPQRGNPAAAAAELAVAGYVQNPGTATGPFGSWSLDITPFASLAGYPAAGRFVSLLALSGHGVLNFSPAAGGQTDGNFLERCPGLSGAALAECAVSNELYTDVRFRAFDRDADGAPDEFGAIEDVYSIRMGAPADSDGDSTVDTFPEITGLLRLQCGAAGSSTVSAGTLLVDCAAADFTGDARIGNSLTVAGTAAVTGNVSAGADMDVTGELTAERFLAEAIGGQDLTKGIFTASVIAMDGSAEISQPQCLDTGSEPAIFVAPVTYASPDGSPIVGLKAIAETVTGRNSWKVRIQAAIDRDSNSDGNADVVDLTSDADHALVMTKCS